MDNEGEPAWAYEPEEPAPADWTDYSAAEDAQEPPEAASWDEGADSGDAGDPGPGDGRHDDGYYTDPQPTGVYQISGPWQGARDSDGHRGAPEYAPPRLATWPDDDGQDDEPGWTGPGEARPLIPVVGPTEALRGRAGGPGFTVPPGAVSGLYDPAQRSGWQLAQGLWEESGIFWETLAAQPPQEPGWDQYEPSASPGHPWQDSGWQDSGWQDSGRQASGWQDGGWRNSGRPDNGRRNSQWQDGGRLSSAGQDAGPHGGSQQNGSRQVANWQADTRQDDAWQDSTDWQAGTRQDDGWQADTRQDGGWQDSDWQDSGRQADAWQDDVWQGDGWQAESGQGSGPQGNGRQAGAWQNGGVPLAAPTFAAASESDELYRAWQGSVRQATARPGPRLTPARRHQVWNVVRVGVPAAILVTVGAGAVMMLTGKTNGMLATSASDGTPTPGAGGSAMAFTGYPGQHGTVTVNSIATAAGTRLAVGSADGHPAIWRRAADGTWTLVSAATPGLFQRPGMESLTSVAHGPAGWIAVGDVVSGAAQQPVVVTSSDGVTWQATDGAAPFTAPGTFVMAVTASQNGYVVVGKQVSGGRTFAALWWSGDLRTWVTGSNGGLDGRLQASAVYAVGATATGFVAAGTHGGYHTIWTSTDGRTWSIYDVPEPPGATNALLSQVAVNGSRVVTAGYVVGKAGDIPVVVVSTDGGAHWQQILLTAPAGLGSVSTLTAAGNGFVAAGEAGPAGAQHAVTWSSPDGLTWSAATPVSAGQITALTSTGATVSGTAQRGLSPDVVTFAAP